MAMTKSEAWDYALGMIKVDGIEPSKEFLQLVEKEKKGEISEQDVEKWLYKKWYNKTPLANWG